MNYELVSTPESGEYSAYVSYYDLEKIIGKTKKETKTLYCKLLKESEVKIKIAPSFKKVGICKD